MWKFFTTLLSLLLYGEVAFGASSSDMIRQQLINSVPHYTVWGSTFINLQVHYFKILYLLVIFLMLALFALHYSVVGPKVFDERGEKIEFFDIFNMFIHWIAALSFTILVPTGLIMVFSKYFGGGIFVRSMRYLHDLGAILFAVSAVPMFFMWVQDMLPNSKDLQWLATGGSYLTKEKIETGADKFNLGQKFWFWVVVFVGSIMFLTGLVMYYGQIKIYIPFFDYQIDFLRFVAILHNFLAMFLIAMFFVHLYMSLFAVKGSLKSMLTGYKSEEEVKYLHSTFYKKFMEQRKRFH